MNPEKDKHKSEAQWKAFQDMFDGEESCNAQPFKEVLSDFRRDLGNWQKDCKGCSVIHTVFYQDIAAMFSNDSLRYRKSEACSLSLGFCGEKGVENVGFDMVGNAGPAVRKICLEITPFFDGAVFDNQGSAVGHCVDGIQYQV